MMFHWRITDHTACGRRVNSLNTEVTSEIDMITCSTCLAMARLARFDDELTPGLTEAEQGKPA